MRPPVLPTFYHLDPCSKMRSFVESADREAVGDQQPKCIQDFRVSDPRMSGLGSSAVINSHGYTFNLSRLKYGEAAMPAQHCQGLQRDRSLRALHD